jgi:hypothetical protein
MQMQIGSSRSGKKEQKEEIRAKFILSFGIAKR